MKSIGVVTDSHSGITKRQAEELGIFVLPMPFYIDGICCYEDVTLTRQEFFERLDSGKEISTSQPSPESVTEIWNQALKEYETILYIPLSSGLSGSCATACMLAGQDPYRNRVFVVDNGRVSVPLHRSVLDALELIGEGYSAEETRRILEESRDRMSIYIGVQTLEHLRRGGRISATSAALGTVLNIKPVLRLGVGTLDLYKKCHGFTKARSTMIQAVKQDMETRFRRWYETGEICLMSATSAPEAETREWEEEIRDAFPGMPLLSGALSLGVCCHIGAGGLGIGCSCRPERPQKER